MVMARPAQMAEMKKKTGSSGRIPERIELAGNDQVQAAEGRLVECGENYAGDHQRNHDGVQPLELALPAKALEHDGQKFQEEHGGVQHHAPGNFKHHRVVVPHDDGVPDAIRPAEIEDQRGDEHGVAQERREDHGAEDGTIAFEVENIDDGGESEAASGKSHGEQFETDPQSPGKFVGEVGGLPEAVGEAVDQASTGRGSG